MVTPAIVPHCLTRGRQPKQSPDGPYLPGCGEIRRIEPLVDLHAAACRRNGTARPQSLVRMVA